MIDIEPFGTSPSGETVRLYRLHAGTATISVTNFGAALTSVIVPDSKGDLADIVLGFESLEGYFDNPACHGATIGPSANRTDRGEIPLGNALYRLPRNDGPNKANNLHSDLERGLHKRVWEARVDEPGNSINFTCVMEDGEIGLPGTRTFSTEYALRGDEAGPIELTISHRCVTNAPTFVNMTNHTYFNLSGHGSGSVLNHRIRIPATHYLPLRPDGVSSGEIRTVDGTPFDFRSEKPLGRDMDLSHAELNGPRGYDHCLCIDGFEPASGVRPRLGLHAEDPFSHRTLDIEITAPGAHLYTGNWLEDRNAKEGAYYAPHDGFAFEPEFYPDNLHHESWPHPICAPGHPYTAKIVYRFSNATTTPLQ